ncbi:putative ATP-grasp target RiPP [Herbihabitans rhizosphaerae]|uniref:Putative ATP-grasp target RiPP n=1 Tax=Herbihabitans rhizosphaerae TaxID=1872711 RepID=A0A4Q7KV59_9PSEU|nr:putative ATP-grasp target RiPP [Herbihabitans rhizosphaerae]
MSSAALRYLVREPVVSDAPGASATRPFGLRGAVTVPTPVLGDYVYSDELQVAVNAHGRPLIEMGNKGKDWATKGSTDGDEGPEEDWGWEEK